MVNATVSPSAGVLSPVARVLTVTKFASPTEVPLLFPSLPSSVSLAGLLSTWSADTATMLVNAPGPSIVPVTMIVTSLKGVLAVIVPKLQGKVTQPPPVIFVIVTFVGVSVTNTFVAVSVPKFLTTIFQETVSPGAKGPD